MTTSEAERIDAAEYALGLGEPDERRLFETALLDDPDLADAVWEWEEAFRPLADAVRPRAAPARGWRGIETRLFAREADTRRAVRRAVSFWRAASALFLALTVTTAAALVVAVVRPDLVRPDLLQADQAPVQDWIAAIVRADGTVALAKIGQDGNLVAEPFPAADGDREPELWLVPQQGSPVSMGILRASGRVNLAVPQAAFPLLGPTAQFVVTAEPPGGSPTGAPTGPALGSGALTRI